MPSDTSPARIHDFVAIGLGPFNLGLACLTEPIPDLDGLFLESKPDFDWHPGMLLEGTTLQTPFLSDLVTLADPTSRYSFLNFLKQTGRIYPFYIRESFFPLRSEYVEYCRWAAAQLTGVRFSHTVTEVTWEADQSVYTVRTDRGTTHRARHLVLGTGTPPYLPEPARGLGGDTAVHTSGYLPARARLRTLRSITVLGSGQSAAEVFRDLLQDLDAHDYTLTWATRSPRFFPLEYTKLTLELTSPEYVDYFHELPPDTRDRLITAHKGLYKGINSELINEIHELLYRKRSPRVRLLTNSELTTAAHDPDTRTYTLGLHQHEQRRDYHLHTQGLVLATGYRHRAPDFLAPIHDHIAWDPQGRFEVRRDYRIDAQRHVVGGAGNCARTTHGAARSAPDAPDGVRRAAPGHIYVQNAELHTHGFVTPDLGLAAYRNSRIIRSLLGRSPYPVEKSIAFQQFAAPEGALA